MYVWNLRKKLSLEEGFPLDNEAIQQLDERLWHLMFRINVLTAGEAAEEKLLSEIGIHQN